MTRRKLLPFILGLLFTGSLSGARESVMDFKGFELIQCNQHKKCVKVKAKTAQSGQISSLIALNEVEIEISQRQEAKTKESKVSPVRKSQGVELTREVTNVERGDLAYYSASDEKIVLTRMDGSDFELNLKDLSEKHYK